MMLHSFESHLLVSQCAQALNETFYSAFTPVAPNYTELVDTNLAIFSQFNTTLAYNPFSQVSLCHRHDGDASMHSCCGSTTRLVQ